MRERIQDAVNDWFVANRDPKTGEYPDFPTDAKGGSRDILDPPPPPPPEPEPEDPKAKAAREKKEAAEKKKEEEKRKKAEEAAKKAGIVLEDPPPDPPKPPSEFLATLRSVQASYRATWGASGASDAVPDGNFEQKFDAGLVVEKLRPAVFEEVRKEVDVEMRQLLKNLKEMIRAEREAKKGGSGKAKGAGRRKGGKGGRRRGPATARRRRRRRRAAAAAGRRRRKAAGARRRRRGRRAPSPSRRTSRWRF